MLKKDLQSCRMLLYKVSKYCSVHFCPIQLFSINSQSKAFADSINNRLPSEELLMLLLRTRCLAICNAT